ncbi:MAG: GAF domain-containing protein [Bacteroidales bacterium]|nr:GAF domain-containing protein [Bacteroidales bacterium]
MAENLRISEGNKEEKYALLVKQIENIIKDEEDMIANMANIAAMIQETFGFWWTGFYRVIGKELVLGPFQGPLACSRIGYGKGVCGTAWKNKETVIVEDVSLFPGHIACSSASKSEIVVPIFSKHNPDNIIAVLDIDSELLSTFDESDKIWLEKVARILEY